MTTTPAPTINVLVPEGTATGPWPTGWTYADPDDVWVYIETGGEPGPDLVLDVDYTLSGSNPRENGGEVTLSPAAVPVGGWRPDGQDRTRLIVRRWTSRRQGVALPDAEGHKPRATEMALDRAMRIAEELSDQQDLAVVVPPGGVPPTAADLEAAAQAGALAAEAAAVAQQAADQVFDKANRTLNNASRQRDVDLAEVVEIQAFLDDLSYRPLEFGAASIADVEAPECQRAQLQAMIDAMPKGRRSELTGVYYIGPGQVLHVRPDRLICGGVATGEILDRSANWKRNGTIILGAGAEIHLYNSARLDGVQIVSEDAAKATIPNRPYDAWQRIRNWSGTAIRLVEVTDPKRDGGADVTITHCGIYGFRTAVRADGLERLTFSHNKVDCHNGVLLSNSYDTTRIHSNQFWGFWAAHRYVDEQTENADASGNTAGRAAYDSQPPGFMYKDTQKNVMYFRGDDPNFPHLKWYSSAAHAYRDGAAIGIVSGDAFAGRVDGAQVIGNLNYGHKYGLLLSAENYACHIYFNEFSGTPSTRDELPTWPIHNTGHTVFTKFIGNHCDSGRTNYNMLAPIGSIVSLYNNTSGAFSDTSMSCGDGEGVVDGFISSSSRVGAFLIGFAPNCGKWSFDNIVCGETGITGLFNIWLPSQKQKIVFGPNIRAPASLMPDRRALTAYVEAKGVGTQTVAAETGTKVAFGNVQFDGHGLWDAGGFNFNPAESGLYRIEATISFSVTDSDQGVIYAGVSYSSGPLSTPIGWRRAQSGEAVLSFSTEVWLNAPITIWIEMFSERGGAISGPASTLKIRKVF